MKTINKILVFRLSSIGDIILTTPVLRCLRQDYPDAQIIYVVKKEFVDLLRHNPHISKIIAFDKNTGFKGLRALCNQIRKEQCDVFIDLHKNLRSRYVRFFSGIRFIFSFHKRTFFRSMLIRFKWNLYPEIKPVYLRYFEAVEALDVTYDEQGTEVFIPEYKKTTILELLKKENPDDKKIMVLSPGASFDNKKWPFERFIELAKFYIFQNKFKIALIGGSQDIAICETIRQDCQNAVINLAGKCSLLESAAVIAASDVVITNDTGMMHMAQSQKIPVVAIFGPTTKELGYYPIAEKSCVVEVENLDCRPCSFHGLNYCPKKHHRCMKDITTKQVIEATNALLKLS